MVQWSWEKTDVKEVVCSNPSAGYQLDIFTLICKICIVRLKSTNINEKEAKDGPLKQSEIQLQRRAD